MGRKPRELRDANAAEVQSMLNDLISAGASFTHTHSNYTNSIETGDKVVKWTHGTMDKAVFMAARTLERDLTKNPAASIINRDDHNRNNYGNIDVPPGYEIRLDKVINLDISAAYANTLRSERLICRETYDLLMRIPKRQRLAAVGMIAYNRLIFHYKDGACVEIEREAGPFRNIFFYLISKVQEIMIELADIAGPAYIFHWVDGIFLHSGVPERILDRMEKYVKDQGQESYQELATDFHLVKRGHVLEIEFNKLGERKEYKFTDEHYQARMNKIIRELHSGSGTASFTQ